MSAEVKSHLTELLTRALAKVAPQQPGSLISLERPKQAQHGDFSCPAAMQLARALKRNPRELALDLVAALPRRFAISDFRFRRGFEKSSAYRRNFPPTVTAATMCARSPTNTSKRATPTARIRKL